MRKQLYKRLLLSVSALILVIAVTASLAGCQNNHSSGKSAGGGMNSEVSLPAGSSSQAPSDNSATPTEDIVIVGSIDDYVYTKAEFFAPYYGSLKIMGEEGYEGESAPNRLPMLRIDSDDAAAINTEIENTIEDQFTTLSSSEYTYGRIDYVAFLNGSVLSLAIEFRSVDTPTSTFHIYNIDVKTGKKLSFDQVIALTGMSTDDAYDEVSAAIEDIYSNITTTDQWKDFLEEQKEKSLADENLHSTQFYLNENGNLTAGYRYYGVAGAESYGEIAELSGSYNG
ncbi:MAG: hypothetical protein IJJ15_10630 [Ruminococcus sp.]|nr:hypothetical protein [Ruminococcus sp.]